jgi:hypothetical protein
MYNSIVEECLLLLSLFHLCWLFDGLAVLHNRWVMTWDLELGMLARRPGVADRYAGDRYTACGAQRVEESVLAILDKLKSLPPRMAELFASSFVKGAESLLAQQEKQLASQQQFPATLPALLVVKETPLIFKRGKRRAMTGLEAAEERNVMLCSNGDGMREKLLHLQQLIEELRYKKKKSNRKTKCWRHTWWLIHSSSYSLASSHTWMLIFIS